MSSHEVGLIILRPLQELDEVAYMRFASVYRGFESLADFEEEIVALRSARNGAGHVAPGHGHGNRQPPGNTACPCPNRLRSSTSGGPQS